MQWGGERDVAGRERWRERAVVTAAAGREVATAVATAEAAQLKL